LFKNTDSHSKKKPPALKLFSGRSNLPLAIEVSRCLGVELGKIKIKDFSDGEIYVKIQESVRGDNVYIIQPTSDPVNQNLMELLIIVDALKRASAERINVIMPYFGYARQDRKVSGREPITAKLVANLLYKAGAFRVLTLDLHASQIMGFFDCLVDHMFAVDVLADYVIKELIQNSRELEENFMVVSPDVGGVSRVRAFAKRLNQARLAIIDKRRSSTTLNKVQTLSLIGDVKNKTCIIYDDIIDTAGTICQATELLLREGASKVFACATHGVLSGQGIQNIKNSKIEKLIITDSIALTKEKEIDRIDIISIASLLAESISRIHDGKSISSMFKKN